MSHYVRIQYLFTQRAGQLSQDFATGWTARESVFDSLQEQRCFYSQQRPCRFWVLPAFFLEGTVVCFPTDKSDWSLKLPLHFHLVSK
jgi:hypothetical protein